MAKKYPARLALDKKSWGKFKKQLEEMEKVARKKVQDEALRAGAEVIQQDAISRAPGPHIIVEVLSGRTLKKIRKSAGVKGNTRVAAVGPDKKHWYYRFAEFGAKPHDVSVDDPGVLRFAPSGEVKAWAKRAGGIKIYAFLRRAVESKSKEAIKRMGDVLAKAIDRAFKQ